MLDIKKYDKFLFSKKEIDGTTTIYRRSPFGTRDFDLFKIQNQFIGSGRWIKDKLIQMDCQRSDIFGDVEKHNKNIHDRKDDNTRIGKMMGDYISEMGSSFLT